MIPAAVLEDLTREAAGHLSDPDSSSSLNDLCRRFLDQHSIPTRPWPDPTRPIDPRPRPDV
jgi:hypothetical protein